MKDIIRQFRAHDLHFNPAATATELKALADAIECKLPAEIAALYLDHNGSQWGTPWRLMSIEEVVKMHRLFSDWAAYGLRFFWNDNNSNYAGVYVSGPLAQRVCVEIHDGHDLSPRFRSIRSFLEAVLPQKRSSEDEDEDEEEDVEMRFLGESDFDYPMTGPKGDPKQLADDWHAVQALQSLFASSRDDQRRDYAKCMMALTPPQHTAAIVPFLDEDDMWLPERAANILGARKFEPAIGKLEEVALKGMMNGYQMSIVALGKIGTKASLQALIRINDAKICGHDYLLAEALEACGCETRSNAKGHAYRLPGSFTWVPIQTPTED